jgi:predicted lipoprotein
MKPCLVSAIKARFQDFSGPVRKKWMNCDGCQNLEIENGDQNRIVLKRDLKASVTVVFVFTGSRFVLPIGHNHIGCDILS